jgi:hypothetical protein
MKKLYRTTKLPHFFNDVCYDYKLVLIHDTGQGKLIAIPAVTKPSFHLLTIIINQRIF